MDGHIDVIDQGVRDLLAGLYHNIITMIKIEGENAKRTNQLETINTVQKILSSSPPTIFTMENISRLLANNNVCNWAFSGSIANPYVKVVFINSTSKRLRLRFYNYSFNYSHLTGEFVRPYGSWKTIDVKDNTFMALDRLACLKDDHRHVKLRSIDIDTSKVLEWYDIYGYNPDQCIDAFKQRHRRTSYDLVFTPQKGEYYWLLTFTAV